jgi:protein-tyrosine phosphatase
LVDLHCHILPEIDESTQSLSDSIRLLSLEKENGVSKIVFTPHFNFEKNHLEEFLEKRKDSYARLISSFPNTELEFSFVLSAEVAFSPKVLFNYQKLLVGNTHYLLLELPLSYFPDLINDVVFRLISNGIIPIICHVDRYRYFFQNPLLLFHLVNLGAMIQVNASPIVHDSKVRRFVSFLDRHNLFHCIASDTHSVVQRPPEIKNAYMYLRQLIGEEKTDKTKSNAESVFQGKNIIAEKPTIPVHILTKWI